MARFPADKRPVKLHNVHLALGELQKAGCVFEVTRAANGMPSFVILIIMIYCIQHEWQAGFIKRMQGIKTLKGTTSLQPIDVIDGDREMTLSLLWRLILQFQLPQLVNAAAVKMEIERIEAAALPGKATALCIEGSTHEHVALMLHWVQTVCAQYNESVTNFTSAFADGHVLCLLVRGSCLHCAVLAPWVLHLQEFLV